jgi:hypothetical protein
MRHYRANVGNRVGLYTQQLEPSSGAISRVKRDARQPQETGRITASRETLDESPFHHVEVCLLQVMIVVIVIVRQVRRLPLGCMRRRPVIVSR